MALASMLVYLALLTQVVEAPKNISTVTLAVNAEMELVALDKRLCNDTDPPVFPQINAVFLFSTPPTRVCTPNNTILGEFIESPNKTLSYSNHGIKCSLHKKEGIIEKTDNSNSSETYTAIAMVTNMLSREWNRLKKDLLYRQVSTHHSNTLHNVLRRHKIG